jgi:chromosome partitioning protein
MFIAIVNQKGGVGKTTVAVHLAMYYAERGLRTSLVDTDEQQTASRWVTEANRSIHVVAEHEADGLIERATELSRAFDVVIADGPANLAECMRALLLVADVAVVPCGVTIPELESTAATIRMLRNAHAVRRGELPAPLLVLSRVRSKRYRLTREAFEAAGSLGIPVARASMPFREAIADAPGQRKAVWQLGRSARDAAEEPTQLLEEITDYAHESTKRADDAFSRTGGVSASGARAA